MIGFITDFGLDDPYVGVLKGVIATINPAAHVVDLCNGIPPYFTHAASFVVEKHFRYFPPTTIFLVVVDPDVGTDRNILLVGHQNYIFIAPDNGVLTPILTREGEVDVRVLTADHLFLDKTHTTFEARDRMAPIAAHISRGINWQFMGEPIDRFVTNADYFPRQASERRLSGMVLHIDHFGNIITNFSAELIQKTANACGAKSFKASLADREITDWRSHYAGPGGKPFMILGSHGNLEISMNQQSAAQELKATWGAPLAMEFF